MNSPIEIPRMDEQATERVTALLNQWRCGDDEALSRAVAQIYGELRRLAGSYLRGNPSGATVGPTALVHEFYLKASGLREVDWESRGQFIAAAARAMRNLLVDNARRKMAEKHGAGRIEALGDKDFPLNPEADVLVVNEALDQLAGDYPRHSKIVELIFFGGLSAAEAAEALSLSQRTVERDWRFARAWLKSRMDAPLPTPPGRKP